LGNFTDKITGGRTSVENDRAAEEKGSTIGQD